MSVREGGAQPLTSGGAVVEAGHLGRGSRLVDEDQPCRVEIELALEPVMTALEDVGTILLRRMPRLYGWPTPHQPAQTASIRGEDHDQDACRRAGDRPWQE